MNILDLLEKVKISNKNRTRDDEISLLIDAKIIDKNGFLCGGYFSKESIENDIKTNNPLV